MLGFILQVVPTPELTAQFSNVSVAPINKAVAKDGGVAWADFNNDGFPDLIINTNNSSNVNGRTRIFISNSATSWTDITSANAPSLLSNTTERSVMAGDIDGDGDLDFMRSTSNRIEIYRNNGPIANPSFTISQTILAGFFSPSGMNNEGLSWMDFDGDGDLDVFMENHQYGMDILQNDGTGTFTHYSPDGNSRGFPTTGTSGDYSVTADLNNDGHIDIVARREGTSAANDEIDIFINNGDGSFSGNNTVNLQTVNSAKGGVAVGDFDNDGDFDFIWTNNGSSTASNTVTLVEQDGVNSLSFSLPSVTVTSGDDGTLTALPVNQNIEGIAVADVNNDGNIDIFLAAASGPSYLLLNNSTGQGDFTFVHDNSGVSNTSINPINVNGDGEGIAFADYDNDGDMDFYLNVNGAANQLWQNNIIASPTNYLKVIPLVDLGGGLSIPALGATVLVSNGCEIFSGIQEVSSGVGHGSQNDSRLHAGLPDGPNRLYRVEIGFVRPNGGSRNTVVKYVTPTALTNQTLTVLSTDSSDPDRDPNAVDDVATTDENTLVSIPVLSNDSDPMGEGLVLGLDDLPANGSAVINGNNIDYTPDPGFSGVETFTYTITNTSGICGMATVTVTVNSNAPFLDGYDCRKQITIDATMVSGSTDLSNFPMLVSFTDAELATVANGGDVTHSSGYDIAFTENDGTTQLNHEILNYDSVTGSYLAFVTVSTLGATANTNIWIYYGNNAVTMDPSTTSTWDSNYQAVLHLQESGNGTDNEFVDATANSHHGTGGGLAGAGSAAGTPTRVAGKFGFAQDFDDSSSPQNHIRLNAVTDATWTAVTVQAWINADDTGDDRIFGKSWGTGTNNQTWLLRKSTSSIGSRMRTNSNNNGGFDPFNYTTGTWYHAAITWDASDNQLIVFVNGVQRGNTTLNGATLYTSPPLAEPTIGNTATVNRGFDGTIQEARISDIARSADWLLTEFTNQDDPAAFYSVGAEDCDAILAITLMKFEGDFNKVTNAVDLEWLASYDDLNDEGFEIQRSWDGQEFQTIGFIPVKGELDEIVSYSFSDNDVTNFEQTQAFYRLKSIQAGNEISYSQIIRMALDLINPQIRYYPNPTTDKTVHIDITGGKELPILQVVNSSGQLVRSIQLNSFSESLTLTGITPGIYLLKFVSSDMMVYKRLVVF
ncbi:MAG: hypothetical protein DHS20C17_22930 [Cyclobacteriaceae bacterium]|nr:MAG: hypothetical protein DHS20C17_22930 [Cyclobacteriaceae bacterium]